MGRVINTDSTGKQRSALMRTSAELLRHLSQKLALDDEAKDMASLLVYCLREIEEGIDASASVWEKRDYWMKADELRSRWDWAGHAAADLERLILADGWDDLPAMLIRLFPRFNEIDITKFTRKPSLWLGSHARLLADRRDV